LQWLDNDTSTDLAADLLLKWPSLQLLQKASLHQIRKFFYGHNSRGEEKLQERLSLLKEAKVLTDDAAVIEPAVLRVQMLAQQLKSILPYIARYEQQIAQLFDSSSVEFMRKILVIR
jgi:hypothetical protein